jgi:hypothetical protein
MLYRGQKALKLSLLITSIAFGSLLQASTVTVAETKVIQVEANLETDVPPEDFNEDELIDLIWDFDNNLGSLHIYRVKHLTGSYKASIASMGSLCSRTLPFPRQI